MDPWICRIPTCTHVYEVVLILYIGIMVHKLSSTGSRLWVFFPFFLDADPREKGRPPYCQKLIGIYKNIYSTFHSKSKWNNTPGCGARHILVIHFGVPHNVGWAKTSTKRVWRRSMRVSLGSYATTMAFVAFVGSGAAQQQIDPSFAVSWFGIITEVSRLPQWWYAYQVRLAEPCRRASDAVVRWFILLHCFELVVGSGFKKGTGLK